MMHQKKCVRKLLAQTVSAIRVLVLCILLLGSMSAVLTTWRVAVASAKSVSSSSIHSAHPRSITPFLHNVKAAHGTDVVNGRKEKAHNDPENNDDFDNNDDSHVIKVNNDENNKEVIKVKDNEKVVIIEENCEECQECEQQQEEHHHENRVNNVSAHGFVAAAGAGALGGRGAGFPGMPFTGSDPRPFPSK
ncbi:hypothetical protein [Dictyobacter formicarum]|uniref:Uncharacterized protein n=1 Tax=Dictyobacter formicarum TaxID=2778368 RepID=A0ABQ3VCB7_9CHLR|nr:hypothetical protein [Dictyobacter formicarum]GHO83409.1 hypothetical protein KSZ_14150 [Dictyobacter formicarum]